MDDLELDRAQQHYYQDLFVCCEKEGKVPALKATELFRSAELSNEVIRQVSDWFAAYAGLEICFV